MSANKTKATAASVMDFIKSSDPKKEKDSHQLMEIMERLSGEKAMMWGPSIIGFGSYHYKYESGREGDMCRIGFSPRNDKFALYLLHQEQDERQLLDQLGKIKTGASCIYFKKLDDLNLDILEQMIIQSLEHTRKKWGSE